MTVLILKIRTNFIYLTCRGWDCQNCWRAKTISEFVIALKASIVANFLIS